MSDVQLLFLVLAALYVAECLGWLRRGSVAFTAWLEPGWRLRHPSSVLGNQAGGFVLAAPFPPLGTLFVAHQLPLSLSPLGVLAYVSTNVNPGWPTTQTGCFVQWENLDGLRVHGNKLLVNGELLLIAASSGFARHLHVELLELAALSPAQRDSAIARLVSGSFDSRAIESRLREYQARSRVVRRLGNVLFLYLVVIVPGLIWQFGFGRTWLGLLLGLIGFTITSATFFGRSHRALYPAASEERFTHTLTIALAPSSALRAHDALSRPLLENWHPLAVAKLLLPDAEFRQFARRVLLDLRHPAQRMGDRLKSDWVATEVYFRHAQLVAVEEFLTQHGLVPDELGRAPVPADDSCRSFCPRCETQFTTLAGECRDCGGLVAVELRMGGSPGPADGVGSVPRKVFR